MNEWNKVVNCVWKCEVMSQKSQEEEMKRPPSPISEVPHGINVSSEPPGSGTVYKSKIHFK